MMDSRRLAFLNALDIDVWERRELNPANGGQSHGDRREPRWGIPIGSRTADGDQPDCGARRETQAASSPGHERQTAGSPPTSTAASFARSALGWDDLASAVRACTLCPLHTTRTQAVFGVGNRNAQWMVIGEAPGMEEDRQGEPFVGRAGLLLNSMLKAIGLAREQVFIANILKSRPPGNRDPRPEEVRACLPYLLRQIELVDPWLILCVGRIAAQTLLSTPQPIGKLRGAVHRLADRPMIVTYHPAYLLRSPGEKRKVWADLVLAMRTFGQRAEGSAP